MKTAARFSIRLKFLSVLSVLLIACITSYLFLALSTFKQDKTELIFDLNRSLVSGVSNDVESSIRSIKDKLEVFVMMSESGTIRAKDSSAQIFGNDPNLVYITSINRLVNNKKREFVREEFLETYSLERNYFSERILKDSPPPIEQILKEGFSIWKVSTGKDMPPLIGIGKAVVTESLDRTPLSQYAVIAYIQTGNLLQSVAHLNKNQVFITNKTGQLLLQSNQKEFAADSAIVKQALASQMKTQVLTFEDKKQNWMGGFSKTNDGEVIVFTAIEENKAFESIDSFVKRSLLFASIVATIAFIAAVLFSRTLTRPLEILVEGMEKVGAGELETRIVVKSNDETSLLANSFNKMIKDLHDSRGQLEEINRDLENKVKERTIELEDRNRAVKEAQEALIRTTRLASVGEIAARAAHEVLNPLTGMMTRLNIVQKRTGDQPESEIQLLNDILKSWLTDYQAGGFEKLILIWKEKSKIHQNMNLFEEDLENLISVAKTFVEKNNQIRNDAEFLQSEANRISKIVQNMRSLSRVSGQKEKSSLNHLLQESTKIMGDLLAQKKIQVTFNFHSESDQVYVDKDEFIQAITNLLRNSIQAIEESETHSEKNILISTEKSDGKFLIDLQDTGSGISPENQKHLFETQFSTKSKENGTGLGLNISRRFIRAVGGDLFLLKSAPGQGTTFRMTLPLVENHSDKRSVA